MDQRVIKRVAFFGSATMPMHSPIWNEAFETARLLAEDGFEIVDGGGPGIMKAASMGAKEANGKVIGVTYYPKDVLNFDGRDPQNIIDIEIKTDNYLERTLTILREADCYLIYKGGTGTVSEFGMAWGLAKLYFGHHKPLVFFGSFWENIMKSLENNLEIDKEEESTYVVVTSPKEAVHAIKFLDKQVQSNHEHHAKGPFKL